MKTRKQELQEYHAELRLGDRLEWLFKITGIKWLVKKINPNCNCESRKEIMNEIEFKIKRK
jgi:hypothetical protein